MKYLTVTLCLIGLSLAGSQKGCKDKCAKEVLGGCKGLITASSDCCSYLAATPTATIPAYAKDCTCPEEYVSACSCLGVTTACPPIQTCQAGEQLCGTTCTNPLTDPQNCGSCGNICPSGICQNGACATTGCEGSTCDAGFKPCGDNNACVCFTDSNGSGFCSPGAICADLKDCQTNTDCDPGFVCAIGTCCVRNVCHPTVCANPGDAVIAQLQGVDGGPNSAGM